MQTIYPVLKNIHITAVILSGTLFLIRGWWRLSDSPRLQQRWVKIVPHMIDTVLLASAIGLAITLQQYPLVHGWLTAKVIALIVYIGLGMLALRFAQNKTTQFLAWLAALLTFTYIVTVALQRDPVPFL